MKTIFLLLFISALSNAYSSPECSNIDQKRFPEEYKLCQNSTGDEKSFCDAVYDIDNQTQEYYSCVIQSAKQDRKTSCDAIDKKRYPDEFKACKSAMKEEVEKKRIEDICDIFGDSKANPKKYKDCVAQGTPKEKKSGCDAIDKRLYPEEYKACKSVKSESASGDNSMVLCSADNGDGRVSCNGKIYKLDSSINNSSFSFIKYFDDFISGNSDRDKKSGNAIRN